MSTDPLALAAALQKLDAGVAARPLLQKGTLLSTSHLMIANPFRASGLGNWFSTHPPMAQRVTRLQRMAAADPRFLRSALGAPPRWRTGRDERGRASPLPPSPRSPFLS